VPSVWRAGAQERCRIRDLSGLQARYLPASASAGLAHHRAEGTGPKEVPCVAGDLVAAGEYWRSRRRFLRQAAQMAGVASMAGMAQGEARARTVGERRFRFLLWNDMHVRDPEAPREYTGYPFANEKAQWAFECAQGRHGIERPDFILAAGDIIDGELADYDLDFAYLKTAIVDRLPVPYLPCVGNHENGQGEGIPQQNVAYDRAFGADRHNYVFTYSGVAFVVVDTSGAHRMPDDVTATRNASVERALSATEGLPVIIVTHVPLIAMREEEPLKASFGFSSWRVLDTRMLDLIEQEADRVIAVLCGHIHLTGVRERKGIYHIMPGGTCGYPSDFASLDVFREHIRVRMHRAPQRWLDRGDDIHGRPRYDHDYTDSEHPGHESYVWGNAQERDFTIPLADEKRPKEYAPCAVSFVPCSAP